MQIERGCPPKLDSLGNLMSDEIKLQQMSVEDLAQNCAQETKSYFNYQSHDTSYCFELFRRAISERDDSAWRVLIVQYKPSVARWVNRWADKHPDFPLASEEGEDFIAEAFERFWKYFTPAKFGKSQNLEAVLKYLKMCVNGAISDSWRKMRHRQFGYNLDKDDEVEEPVPPNAEPLPEELLQKDEFWKLIQTRLKDQKEYTIVYGSFYLDLSPREIIAEFPGVFRDMKEIYQCKANVWARLERDLEIREFAQH
jgi:RNA polymerase sigma factor (sigma-70 family)